MSDFTIERLATGFGEGVILGSAIVLAGGPLRADPAVLFELVEARVERALAYLEDFALHLVDPLGDGPAVHRLESNSFENQQIEGSLN